MLRKRALYNDMSRYQCCAGSLPCSGKLGESHCPEFCLCTEVVCFFTSSVSSTRFLLQDEMNIQTTKCDNCIIGFMCCLAQFECIFRLIAVVSGNDELEDASEILNCFTDAVFCTVCACMQAQHKIEMDRRDGKFGPPPVMMVPPVQQMSRIDQPLPPAEGHPPQPGQWQSPYGYACPPYIPGYPAAAHPLPHPGYPAAACPPPPPGYPAAASPLPAPGYFPAGCPPPTQNFPSSGYPTPNPQGYYK
ncbi:ENHANCER OF AG-4 protein 2-like [Durio zibethinus]|uniref:ENHANCER OF AG-4 protein 2-like n=1 Tax=Durio zibethinus TaxID=66656 RepID=A0A6P6B0D1_DURZI|nr:ENHANCER OF AG-4 protein 2-like [Durio zibethinus]